MKIVAVVDSIYWNVILRPKQVICLEEIFLERNILAVLVTGFGKSLIFHVLPLALLVTSINSDLVHLITECQTAKEIWDKLKQRFERNTVANKLFLKQKFFSLKMKDSDSLDEHLRRMKEITDQLAAIKAPIPEDEHIVALLLSLPRSYNTLITALTAKGDELSLAQVHQALRSEEEKRGLCKGKESVGRTDKGETALQHEKTSRKPIK